MEKMVKRQYELDEVGQPGSHGYNEQYIKYHMQKYVQHYKKDFFYSLLRSLPPDVLKDAKKVKARVIEHL